MSAVEIGGVIIKEEVDLGLPVVEDSTLSNNTTALSWTLKQENNILEENEVIKEEISGCSSFFCKDKTENSRMVSIQSNSDKDAQKPFSCSYCEYRCSTKTNVVRHIRIHTGEKPFSCSSCEYRCSQRSQLVRHVRIHTGEKPFSCLYCEYKCSDKSNLARHTLWRNHIPDLNQTSDASPSPLLYSQRSQLVKEMRTDIEEKPFSCPYCEYKYYWKSALVRHIRKHTGEKYFCANCRYRCTEKFDLLRHMRVHTGEKPFSCSYCKYRCSVKSKLVNHIRTHTGEKPFSCSYCTHTCSDKPNLMRHIRTHTGERPFSCSYCKYTCSTKPNLIRHMRTHTGEKPFDGTH